MGLDRPARAEPRFQLLLVSCRGEPPAGVLTDFREMVIPGAAIPRVAIRAIPQQPDLIRDKCADFIASQRYDAQVELH